LTASVATISKGENPFKILFCEETERKGRLTVLHLGGFLSQLLGGPRGLLAVLIEVSGDFIPPADGASREEVDGLGQQAVLGVIPRAFLGNLGNSVHWLQREVSRVSSSTLTM